MLAGLIPKEFRGPGLSEVELAVAQEEAEAAFPPDLCELLTETLLAGRGSRTGVGEAGKSRNTAFGPLVGHSLSAALETTKPPY